MVVGLFLIKILLMSSLALVLARGFASSYDQPAGDAKRSPSHVK